MNCVKHPETPAVAFCRTCGKALCTACERPSRGTIFCSEHVPAAESFTAAPPPPPSGSQPGAGANPSAGAAGGYSPYTAPAGAAKPASEIHASPGLAFVLGLIPGVGAIYNGQYVKGLMHVVILGVLINIISSDSAHGMEPLFGMLIAAWVFYMAFEAYHTARKRQLGQPVDEFSSIVPMRGRPSALPAGPVVLIAIGVAFLLNTMEVIRFSQLIRFWPLGLIALGAYMLYERVSPAPRPLPPPASTPYLESGHEQRTHF
ncbi:MAG: B-box zinc finger protein [Acidobacteriaceae bacterium]|nr:B-box zinc finger protein [Acidobacteriaceae bacterium]